MNEFLKALAEMERRQDQNTDKYLEALRNGEPATLPPFTFSYDGVTVSFPLELADIESGFSACLAVMREAVADLEPNE